MRYLTVSAEYNSTGVRELNGGELDKDELGVGDDIWQSIQDWIEEYRPIIMMEMDERKANLDSIESLDERGLELCRTVSTKLTDAKVEYYSEGLLKKIPY